MQTSFRDRNDAFAPPTISPADDNYRYLTDQVAAFLSEAPKAFHREGGEFVIAHVEGHLPRTSIVIAVARLKSDSH